MYGQNILCGNILPYHTLQDKILKTKLKFQKLDIWKLENIFKMVPRYLITYMCHTSTSALSVMT